MPKADEGFLFTCPKCGSHYFGSSESPPRAGQALPHLTRHCHGTTADDRSCRFTWDCTDDYRYCTLDGVSYDNGADFAAADLAYHSLRHPIAAMPVLDANALFGSVCAVLEAFFFGTDAERAALVSAVRNWGATRNPTEQQLWARLTELGVTPETFRNNQTPPAN